MSPSDPREKLITAEEAQSILDTCDLAARIVHEGGTTAVLGEPTLADAVPDLAHTVKALHAEVARLRSALDTTAHAHERDLLRLAHALGFTHEPPSDVDAMVAAVERLCAIIEGRTTPPTDAEIDAHHAAGGSWLTGDTVTWWPASLRGMRDNGETEGCVWIALDRSYRPCAWPRPTAGGGT